MAFRDFTEPIAVRPMRAGSKEDYYVAEEDIKQGQVVREGGTNSDEVEPSATDGERVIGIAAYGASAGETVLVFESGIIVRATSGTGSISAGDPVASHGNSGEEGEVAIAASGDYILGRARKDDNGTNATVEVTLEPEGFVYGGDPT